MTELRRILIFSGGRLGKWALEEIREGDFLLGVDRGALFLLQNNRQPHYVLGDFDSVTEAELKQIRQSCSRLSACDPIDKDFTDTELAYNWALKKKPEVIILMGVTGSRLDHTMANIQLLYRGLQERVPTRIIDESNELVIIDKPLEIKKNRFKYVSLLPATPEVSGITLQGFKYPLDGASLNLGVSLGISNELLEELGVISLGKGKLLVIRSSD